MGMTVVAADVKDDLLAALPEACAVALTCDYDAGLQKAIAGGLGPGPTASKLREMGSEIATPTQMTPEGFAAFIRIDYERMREAAKLAGLTPT